MVPPHSYRASNRCIRKTSFPRGSITLTAIRLCSPSGNGSETVPDSKVTVKKSSHEYIARFAILEA